MSENDVMIRGIIEGLRSVLDEFGADIVRVTFEDVTVIITDSQEGADVMQKAWNDWSDEE